MANGIRMSDTREVELELSRDEARAVLVALLYTLSEFNALGCQDTRRELERVAHTLKELGVEL